VLAKVCQTTELAVVTRIRLRRARDCCRALYCSPS